MKIIYFILLILILFCLINFDEIKLKLSGFIPFTQNKYTSVEYKKRKILIITAENRNDDYIKLHDENFNKYAKKFDYEYLKLDNCLKSESTTYWCKIHKVKEYLNNYDYVMWADSDTIITQFKPIDQYISDYGEPDIIIGSEIINNIIPKLPYCLNAGLFLIKNSEKGKSFLNNMFDLLKSNSNCIKNNKEQGLWAGICYEQGVMNVLCRSQYRDYTYIDQENNIFSNWSSSVIKHNKQNKQNYGLFLHLMGSDNTERVKIMKEIILSF